MTKLKLFFRTSLVLIFTLNFLFIVQGNSFHNNDKIVFDDILKSKITEFNQEINTDDPDYIFCLVTYTICLISDDKKTVIWGTDFPPII